MRCVGWRSSLSLRPQLILLSCQWRRESRRGLNRLLVRSEECGRDGMIHFSPTDPRTTHIQQILSVKPGDTLRVAIIDQGLVDRAEIVATNSGVGVSLKVPLHELQPVSPPNIHLLLACPRPPRLERLLPVIGCLGVRSLTLLGGAKVEKDYFGTQLLRRPHDMDVLLADGVSQGAVDCFLPKVEVAKNMFNFLTNDWNDWCGRHLSPNSMITGLIAQPPMALSRSVPYDSNSRRNERQNLNSRSTTSNRSIETLDMSFSPLVDPSHLIEQLQHKSTVPNIIYEEVTTSRGATYSVPNVPLKSVLSLPPPSEVLIVIGPEGGWTPQEVLLFHRRGFLPVGLGSRILRTDIAVPIILSQLSDWVSPSQP